MAGNAEIVQRAHDALNRGDVDALTSICDPGWALAAAGAAAGAI